MFNLLLKIVFRKVTLRREQAMGIPRLFPFLSIRYPHYFKVVTSGTKALSVDCLFIEGNPLVHNAAKRIFFSERKLGNPYAKMSFQQKIEALFSMVWSMIIEITDVVEPLSLLYIVFDGVAPVAKQAQQRQRRYIAAKNFSNQEWTSSHITPGTLFMKKLMTYIQFKIREEMNKNIIFQNRMLEVIFSPSTVPGEGEHKIMEFILVELLFNYYLIII